MSGIERSIDEICAELRVCVNSWEDEARLIGNVKAVEIKKDLEEHADMRKDIRNAGFILLEEMERRFFRSSTILYADKIIRERVAIQKKDIEEHLKKQRS